MKTSSVRSKTPVRTSKSRHAQTDNGHGNGHGSAPANGHGIRPELTAWLAKPKHNLIGGRWVPAECGKLFDVLNPADGSVLSRVPDSHAEDIDKAVAAARHAFESGPW